MNGWIHYIAVGPMLAGLVASSGYSAGARMKGIRIRRGLLWMILGLQLVAYFLVHSVEYATLVRGAGNPSEFARYHDLVIRSWHCTKRGESG